MRSSDRSLSRLLGRALAFAAPLVVLAIAVEIRLGRVPNSYTVKRDELAARAGTIECLILGSSTGMYGIRPSRLRVPAYNAALVSQSLYYDEQILTRHLEEMPRLKLVVFTLFYAALSYDLADSPESWRQFFYLRFDGIPPEGPLPYDLRRVSLFRLYEPDSLRMLARGQPMTHMEGADGWYDRGPPPEKDTAEERFALIRAVARASQERFEPNLALLDGALAKVRARGITAALVVLPASPAFASAVDPAYRGRSVAAVTKLALARGAVYRDWLEDARFEPGDFWDVDHLNAKGADKFSRVLDEELVGPVTSGATLTGSP